MKNKFLMIFSSLLILLFSSSANAAIINYEASIDGAQADAGIGTGSLATGTGAFTLDTDTLLFSWNIIFSGFVDTNAHIHNAPAGSNGSIEITLGAGSPKIGSATITAGQATDLNNDLWYVNIHSDAFPGGEIRGQISAVPVPAAVWLFGSGLLGLIGVARKKARS